MPDLARAQDLFGGDFLGPQELLPLAGRMGILATGEGVAHVPAAFLRAAELAPGAYLLILGAAAMQDRSPLNLLALRQRLGLDPALAEPCFYNQDWYLAEPFAAEPLLERRWYLLRKTVRADTRGINPDSEAGSAFTTALPSALLCAYAFFAYFFHTGGKRLWEQDYIWCSDADHQGDRIYVGRYVDPAGSNKNGFSIHRHLKIRANYGVADLLR